MRRKKHKNTRRIVSFYRLNHGFREPFKVLLDGNFVHAAVQSNMMDLREHIPKLLGGKCKIYTTQCVMHELRALGPDYKQTSFAAKDYELHKCEHDNPVSAADCLLRQVGKWTLRVPKRRHSCQLPSLAMQLCSGDCQPITWRLSIFYLLSSGKHNKDHWWMATQDRELRGQLAGLPAVPCLHMSVNGLHVEAPSELAKQHVREVGFAAAPPTLLLANGRQHRRMPLGFQSIQSAASNLLSRIFHPGAFKRVRCIMALVIMLLVLSSCSYCTLLMFSRRHGWRLDSYIRAD